MTAAARPEHGPPKPPFSIIFGNPAQMLHVAAGIWETIRWLRYLVLPLVGFAILSAFFNWHLLSADMAQVHRSLGFLGSLLLGLMTTNLLGRLSQGVAMAGYGVPPQKFGIRLLFGLIPRFYLPSSTIRRLPFDQQRRCYAAPLLARLSMFAIGMLGWLVMRRTGNALSGLSLAFGITGFTVFLFTANPIWRADGYRWITAALQQPKLREQANQLLRLYLTRKAPPEAMPPGRAKLLAGYALVSILYMAFFIWFIVRTAAVTLEAQFSGVGVAMFGGLVAMVMLYVFAVRARRQKRKDRKARQKSTTMALSRRDDIQYTTSPDPDGTGASPPSLTIASEPMRSENRHRRSGQSTESKPASGAETDPDLDAILPPTDTNASKDDEDLLRLLDESIPEPDAEAAKAPAAASVPARRSATPPVSAPPPPVPAPAPRASDQLDTVLGVGAARPRKAPLWRRLLIWGLILGALYYAGQQPYPFTVGGEFIVQPVARTQIRARTDGEIVALEAQEGDWVQEDQVLAVLSAWDEKRDISVLEAELEQQRADLTTLTAGPKPEEIALSEQTRTAAAAELESTTEDLIRAERLFETGTIAQTALQDAQTRLLISQAKLDRAEAALALLQAPVLDSEIEAAEAAINRTEQELIFGRLKLEHTNIRAVRDGQIVSTLSGVSVGTFLKEGDLFAELADSRTVLAEIEVPETEIDEVSLGAEVTLRPWSAPDSGLVGTVKRVAPAAEEREFGRIMRVIVEVPNPEGTLAGNMTGFGKITADERPAWQAFTRVFIRFFQIELWSWLP